MNIEDVFIISGVLITILVVGVEYVIHRCSNAVYKMAVKEAKKVDCDFVLVKDQFQGSKCERWQIKDSVGTEMGMIVKTTDDISFIPDRAYCVDDLRKIISLMENA